MKKLGIFAVLLSLGLFTLGCAESGTDDATNGNGEETVTETEVMETETPADDTGAAEEPAE